MPKKSCFVLLSAQPLLIVLTEQVSRAHVLLRIIPGGVGLPAKCLDFRLLNGH
mgnify:CR=1 FL=1